MRTEPAVPLSAGEKNSVVVGSRGPAHRGARALALCSAVLISVTAEGLATRDSTGSNQRKPDFFSPQRNRLPLVSNSTLGKEIFVSKKMLIILTQHCGIAYFHVAYDGANNSIK